MEAIDVKTALVNYNKYQKSLKTTLDKIDYIETKQYKTGGSIIRVPDGMIDNEQRRLGLIEKKSLLQKDIENYKYHIQIANDFLNCLTEPTKSMVKNKYIDKVSNDRLQETYHYDRRQIIRIVDKLIERYIDIT